MLPRRFGTDEATLFATIMSQTMKHLYLQQRQEALPGEAMALMPPIGLRQSARENDLA